MFYKKAVLKNLTVLEALRPETLLIRNSNRGVSCEYCEISRNTYFEEHLQTAASENCYLFSWARNRRPTPLINFSIFFHPGYSYSKPPSINYLGKVSNSNRLFQTICLCWLFEISINERPVCLVFCLVSSCKEANEFCFAL